MVTRAGAIACVSKLFSIVFLVGFSTATHAWHCDGHAVICEAALELIQDSLPDFFIKNRPAIAQTSCDPDLFKQQWATQLRSQESPEHYIDLEYFTSTRLPATRQEFINLCQAQKIDPSKAGYLPYAIAEWGQRLAIALAEHRQTPSDTFLQQKCTVYAGLLAHYAADICQPLHVTIHFDGKVERRGGASPRTGIHDKVDALAGKVGLSSAQIAALTNIPGNDAAYLSDIIHEELQKSAALVDTALALGPFLPSMKEKIRPDSKVFTFAQDRVTAGARFLARVYLASWQTSAKVKMPDWYEHKTSSQNSADSNQNVDAIH